MSRMDSAAVKVSRVDWTMPPDILPALPLIPSASTLLKRRSSEGSVDINISFAGSKNENLEA